MSTSMPQTSSLAASLASLPDEERQAILATLTEQDARALLFDWRFWARPEQLFPPGDWQTWLILTGRGWGKSRTGAEWVRDRIEHHNAKRIALVGATAADVRDTMIEGPSGILSCCPPWNRPHYEPSKRRVTWPNGSVAVAYSADEPNRLRGPQHDSAWCDELCFVAGTLVRTEHGDVPIETLSIGDSVQTRYGVRSVVRAGMTNSDAELYKLITSDGKTLTGTKNHPVFVAGKGFTPLHLLARGDIIDVWDNHAQSAEFNSGRVIREPRPVLESAATDSGVRVHSVEKLSDRAPVYNIEVDRVHEYYANGILVHNCAWRFVTEAWDMLMFGLRMGEHPQCVITTTPRPLKLLKDILADRTTIVTRGSLYENADNLAPNFVAKTVAKYQGTRLGRQEIDGEVLDDVPGALWTRAMIDACRWQVPDPTKPVRNQLPPMLRVVVAVDPAVTSGEDSDDTGIVVVGLGNDWQSYVLADLTCHVSPHEWATVAVNAYGHYHADKIVGEVNNGGDLVETVIRTVDPLVPFKKVTASRGKRVRAEPIASLYEQGRVCHVGSFADLEDQMCNYVPGSLMQSPDRMDALVWALTELYFGEADLPEVDYQIVDPVVI